MHHSSEEYYTLSDIQDIFNTYVTEKQLINPQERQYINVSDDDALWSAVTDKTKERPEFLKRDDALRRIRDNMQSWHRIGIEGGEAVLK